uniref:Oxalate:formate antiporter n=1 Tax=Echinococcus granulosus TaxID=6210 RepID=A0A068WEM9_ECHGR|nr:oxalate:formate antiporter [Echinococcus granulosus]
MSPYIISYIRKKVDKNTNPIDAIWLSGVCLGVQGIFMPIAGLLALKTGVKFIVGVSCLLNSLGIMLSYVSIQWGFILFVMTYSLMVGIGVSASYSVLLSIATAWMPNARGLVLGLCACMFGAGAIVLTPIQTVLINPTNIKPNNVSHLFEDEALLFRVPPSILTLGAILGSLQLIGWICVKVPSENLVSAEDEVLNEVGEIENYPPLKVLRTADFYVLWLTMLCGIFPVIMIMSLYKIIGQKEIKNDRFLTAVGTLSSVANMLGRLMWGELADRIFYKASFCKTLLAVVYALWSLLFLILPFSPHIPNVGMYLFAILVILLFICIAGLFVLTPYAARKLFGQEYFAANFGLIFSAVLPGAMVGSAISVTANVHHHVVHLCLGCAASCFAGFVAALTLPSGQRNGPRALSSLFCHKKPRGTETSQSVGVQSPQL